MCGNLDYLGLELGLGLELELELESELESGTCFKVTMRVRVSVRL